MRCIYITLAGNLSFYQAGSALHHAPGRPPPWHLSHHRIHQYEPPTSARPSSLDMEGRRSRAGERKEEEKSRVEEREGGMKVRVPERPPLLRSKSLVLMEEAAGGKGEMFFKEKCSNKGELLKHLSKTGFLEPENPAFFHGRIYSRCPPAPVVAWHSSDNPR